MENDAPSSPPAATPGPAGIPVTMIRENLDNLPAWSFPEGYGMTPMQPGDERLWEDIQRDAEPFFPIEDGLFLKEFGQDLEAAWQRVFLVRDPRSCAVGTMGAWYNRNYRGRDFGRIHWVATRPSAQGHGLAKASLAEALRFLARHHEQAYLDTQTLRTPAISIYLDAGFRPLIRDETARSAWAGIAYNMGKPTHTDWINEAVLG